MQASMDGSLEMPNEQILEVLDRLAKRLGLAQKWEVLPTEKTCSMDSFQGRLRNKGTNRFNFCKSKSPCTDCSCAPPKQAKGHTEKQPEVSPLLKKSKDRKAEIYGGFEKGKMSKKKLEKLIAKRNFSQEFWTKRLDFYFFEIFSQNQLILTL